MLLVIGFTVVHFASGSRDSASLHARQFGYQILELQLGDIRQHRIPSCRPRWCESYGNTQRRMVNPNFPVVC
jgi:hypothetical protein